MRDTTGRPRLECDQPDLLKAIADIALIGSATDDRRRTEMIRSCKTLDSLHEELRAMGFNLSRSGTYLRLIPRNVTTIEGKRHVKTAPVKLLRAQATERKLHKDGRFTTATVRYVLQIYFSSKYRSKDNKK